MFAFEGCPWGVDPGVCPGDSGEVVCRGCPGFVLSRVELYFDYYSLASNIKPHTGRCLN
jgi:hypothetical protein